MSNASMEVDDHPVPVNEEEEEEEEKVVIQKTSRGRTTKHKSYVESSATDDELDVIDEQEDEDAKADPDPDVNGVEEDDEGMQLRKRLPRLAKRGNLNGAIMSDGEGEAQLGRYQTRNKSKLSSSVKLNGTSSGGRLQKSTKKRSKAASRQSHRRTRPSVKDEVDDAYVDDPADSASGDDSAEELAETSDLEPAANDAEAGADADAEGEPEETDDRPYAFRQRSKVNYAIPPPIEEMQAPPAKPRSKGKNSRSYGARPKAPGWSATGAQLDRWLGGAGDDSDSDYPTRTPRKGMTGGFGGSGGLFAGSAGTGGLLPSDLAAGTPSHMGKIGEATLADADPLGVNQNVNFDEVGGLDDHINALKEMTLLPLLYPEVFQRFNLTPPRGVLFHGPPGTGKTLLARALAASCRSNGKGISFFMRKGADCLSKWVGEAERQLRLLFEEAKNSQPSIIFFDEIDGLAPVRSSKQDQIHASIVSTLLALMDGMDGRGQVVVIGATNRPDAIDPALRRPGRFDREFYFPLPNMDARERIVRIMTRKWAGWEEEKGEENAKGLAKLTKGYGGADLRALCTEAALNAVQRRYPQIYKSQDRLLLQPESINVELRDFMISVKKMVPSSARATAPAASPLPDQLVPLLQEALDKIKSVIHNVLPVGKKRTALEEAEWEDEGEEGALERELMQQSMEMLRVHRPRVILHGASGMGQAYVAAAALHHLEGYHVQTLDIANLMSDSTRTPEAAIVQLFVEAKRHQPSVVYIPSLSAWCAAVSETSRTTLRTMLDGLAPTDPVLLLATVDGSFTSLPRDVRSWFGPTRENRVVLSKPTLDQRDRFFEPLIKDVLRPPNQFPDGIPRKKRVLEELPLAPPIQPRAPTAAELAMQQESDMRTMTFLRYRLGPILTELKRKFKRFTKRAAEEYNHDFNAVEQAPAAPVHQIDTVTTTVEVQTTANGIDHVVEVIDQEHTEVVDEPMNEVPDGVDGLNEAQVQLQVQVQPQLFDVDLERMHIDLYRDKYLTPDEFLNDIRKIVHNANVRVEEDPERLYRAQAMLTAAEVSCQDFDANFRMECERMAARESRRREEYRKIKAASKAAQAEKEKQDAEAAAPRRSTRNSGQPLEISITDPLKLERRLKRARSTEGTAEPSEEENGESHTAKRSRVSSAEIQMDGVQQDDGHLPTPPERHHAVRFVENIADKTEPSSPSPHANDPVAVFSTHEHAPEPPARVGGFDPSLLNPLTPPLASASGSGHHLYPSFAQPHPEQIPDTNFQQTPETIPLPSIELEPAPQPLPAEFQTGSSTEVNGIEQPQSLQQDQQPELVEEPNPELMIVVERTPTPLPDFVVDADAVSQLKQELHAKTEALNVEELEQLRAMCLARVWKHRSTWDRNNLLQELMVFVREFVEEVAGDEMDVHTP
ncbi:hypothetical protein BDY19DRAFT_926936 [Irpex rosettiformis]|uniref:Uncharacterized protein n=1 Tax=Irpex rosettiformis TaxID=378272 RepID=A0ACB8UF32_9APHY|nr:hypothetical protein BDY19DRAFT_926936 [Irpex rosettiformis]